MDKRIQLNGVMIDINNPETMYDGWKTVERLAGKIVRRHFEKYGKQGGAEFEDLMQVAYMAFDSAVKGFDPSKGVAFTTYYTSACAMMLRREFVMSSNSNKMLDQCESLEEMINDEELLIDKICGGDTREEVETQLVEEEAVEILQRYIRRLSANEQYVVNEYLGGKTSEEISREHRGENIRKVMREALHKLRRELLSAKDTDKEVEQLIERYLRCMNAQFLAFAA